jgi:hypothetical protein
MEPHVAPDLSTASRIASVAVIFLCAFVLTVWFLDVPTLTSFRPGLAQMSAGTAIRFILIGLSLLLLTYPG